MCAVAVELAAVVENQVVGGLLVFAVVSQGPVREIRRLADEGAVVVDGVGMVGGQQQFAVEPVDAARIAV